MITLKVRLNQRLDYDSRQQSQVIANVYKLASDGKSHSYAYRNKTIPAGAGQNYQNFDVNPGYYLVEAVLPSGDTVSEEILIERQDKTRNLELSGPAPMSERMSWQLFVDTISTVTEGLNLNLAGKQRALNPSVRLITVDHDWIPMQGMNGENYPTPDVQRSSRGPTIDWNYLLPLIRSDSETAKRRITKRLSYARRFDSSAQRAECIDSHTGMAICYFASQGNIGAGPKDLFESFFPYREKGAIPRFFIVVSGNHIPPEISVLPIPWAQVDFQGEAEVEVMVPKFISSDRKPDKGIRMPITQIAVRDRQVGSTLGYITSGDLPSAAVLVKQARDMLFEKLHNPFAAAAGGYVLAATETAADEKYWHQWVRNLMNWFPWLPDGAILYAWLKLRHGDSDEDQIEAKRALLTAYRRGIPFFALGVRWLLDGLTILNASGKPKINENEEFQVALNNVHTIARRINTRLPFTSIRLGGNTPAAGKRTRKGR
jgi:hypothetical protein